MRTRRDFNAGLASLAFGGLALASCTHVKKIPDYLSRQPDFGDRLMARVNRHGRLAPSERLGFFDLAEQLTCRIVSPFDASPTSGAPVPDLIVDGRTLSNADGMGSFACPEDGRVILVRNHESKDEGGTTTIEYDYRNHRLIQEYRSLEGTHTNCAGGVTPRGTWLSCEESVDDGEAHGFVYEVPALRDGRTKRTKLERLGRFNHEAAAVDPRTGIVYMTEDQVDSLFYRFVPVGEGDLRGEGTLQALVFDDPRYGDDARNWGKQTWAVGEWRRVRWVSLEKTVGINDPRKAARRRHGAVRFAAGEGIHFGRGELYFACTSGGLIKSGQIMRYRPDPFDSAKPLAESQGHLQLFLESTDPRTINFADNLAVAPNGDLIVCEDPYWGGEKAYWLWKLGSPAPCYLRGITPLGEVYNIARLRNGSELAGVCFSPDGSVLFVNVYDKPSMTLAISGRSEAFPWGRRGAHWSLYDAGTVA